MHSLSVTASATRAISRVALAGVLALGLSTAARAQCPTSDFVTDMKGPTKLLYTSLGNLLVSETGLGTNAGRVSIVEPDGTRRTLVEGLPSSITAEGEGSGPTGMAIKGKVLYLVMGEGDVTTPGAAPASTIPNPNPSSQLFSSVLEIKFSSAVERTTQGFTLTAADQQKLIDGKKVKLKRGGKKITVSLLVNFPDYTANPRPDEENNVRASNPFGAVIEGDSLYVNDASQNMIREVSLADGSETVLATFPQVANPLPIGPPMIDPVPDSIRSDGERLYVTLLTGFPFAAGVGKVLTVDIETGAVATLVEGLTTPIDVLPLPSANAGGQAGYLVLEISTNLRDGAPGRLLRYSDASAEPVVVADCLIGPTHMARAASGEVVLTSLFTNKLQKIALP